MSTTALITDFDVMSAVAAATESRNEEIRTLLQAFIGRMQGVPSTVWTGTAAARFHDVLQRWNTESLRLHRALHDIGATIRHNARMLQEVADSHAQHIAAAGETI